MSALEGDPVVEAAIASLTRGADAAMAIPEAARGFVFAYLSRALRRHGEGPLIVVVADERRAYELASDVTEFWGSSAASGSAHPVEVLPPWESLPFEHLSPSVDTVGTRIRALHRIYQRDPNLALVVASVRAVMQRFSADVAHCEPLVLAPGARFDPVDLANELVAWGYERCFQVEARGEFAVRGGIFDVWPAGEPGPIRLDFAGDEVERIKRFSVDSQRSVAEETGPVVVYPAREIFFTEEIRKKADELSKLHPENASVWERFAQGVPFPGMESWLCWVTDRTEALIPSLPPEAILAVCDPKAVQDQAHRHQAEEEDIAEALLSTWADTWSQADGGGRQNSRAAEPAKGGFPRLYISADRLLEGCKSPLLEVFSAPKGQGHEVVASVWRTSLRASAAVEKIAAMEAQGWQIVVAAGSDATAKHVAKALTDEGLSCSIAEDPRIGDLRHRAGIYCGRFGVTSGFLYERGRLAVLTTQDLSKAHTPERLRGAAERRWERLRHPTARAWEGVEEAPEEDRQKPVSRRRRLEQYLADLEPGDYVVHYYHGIGRYAGMVGLAAGGVERDYLLIEYADDARLYVPTDQLDAVCKYSGGERPRLNRLGGADWAQTKRRARAAAAQVAQYLVELYRERTRISGIAFSPDTPWQRELEDSFPYELTQDQRRALEDVKRDMESPRPMDRLVCGDVGFGKTEIAVRAAFKAVQDGYQVAVLTPTTLLAHQHYETFKERFEPFPVRVEVLSRFLGRARQRQVLEGLADGSVDVVIGTHRLLQGDVSIPKLGLLVIDEEHRFGVAHKESLKTVARNVDVLTLTATPIPRTLEMALAGIRDVSTIETPPPGRQPVLTYVGEYDERAVAAALRRELLRGGQVFYVHNRVGSIEEAKQRVSGMVPRARIATAHGRMPETELERTMMEFYKGDIDVLVTTTIVESGLDIPTVNTLIVERADMLGLAELYQLRGRVGRGKQRAYAYFFYPSRQAITDEAYERLKTIGEHSDLGSGFAIARKDLEIRGAGNILGEAQSGHIQAVGLDLYVRLVAEAVGAMEGESSAEEPPQVLIDLPIDAYLPWSYVPKESLRLEAYRKLAQASTSDEIGSIAEEWEDRYGPVPVEARNLLLIAELKQSLRSYGVSECVYSGGRLRLRPLDLTELQLLRLKRRGLRASYRPGDGTLLVEARPEEAGPKAVSALLSEIAKSTRTRGRSRGGSDKRKGASRRRPTWGDENPRSNRSNV